MVIREQPERCYNGEGRGGSRLIVMGKAYSRWGSGGVGVDSGKQGGLCGRSGNPGRPGVRLN